MGMNIPISNRIRRVGRYVWTVRLTITSTLIGIGVLGLFYGTDEKALAMQLIRALNPASSMLPHLTSTMRPTPFHVRVYDRLVVTAMAVQGYVLGLVIDMIRWFRWPYPSD